MYVLLIALGFALVFWLALRGGRGGRIAGAWVAGGTILFFAGLSFWAEALWFGSIGYDGRFWRMAAIVLLSMSCGAIILGAGVRALLGHSALRPRAVGRWPERVAAGVGAFWGAAAWDEFALFLGRVPTELNDPILGLSTGFYLFVLPMLGQLLWLGAAILAVAATATIASLAALSQDAPLQWQRVSNSLARLSGGMALLIAGWSLVSIFHLFYSRWGVVYGPGWVDVRIRIPALATVALSFLCLALASWMPGIRRRLPLPLILGRSMVRNESARLAVAWSGMLVAATLVLLGVPLLFQWLIVQPNEISFERPYLTNNIEFTRHGFRLHEAEVRQFPASDSFAADKVARNQDLLEEARLWDQGALDAVYKQFQEIRLYYEFYDVDMDRYQIGDRYRQVMVSARELAHDNLPRQSQTFVNKRFKYTHGYGVTIAPVHDFTPDGLPDLLVKDLPPRSAVAELEIVRPEIYYGELTREPAVVNTLEPEFDFPKGDQNVYSRYQGSGGVPLESLWRKFVFGWRMDGTLFLFSSYPREEARVMLHRQIEERVRVLAPFLHFDSDPYMVVSEGRLYWIMDAYTVSDYYPYSEPLGSGESIEYRDGEGERRLTPREASSLSGANYVRNAVKVVIDAYEGNVDFYVFDQEDPLIAAWQRIFPDLFKPAASMPDALRAHVRYPETFLLAQGLVYRKYHMTDAEVFYNQEDLWVRATEKYHSDLQPVRPYYVMWKPPGSEGPEFGLILPFTPKNRQVMIGWIAGLCDGENYGRFIAYQFPKERRVLGPQQVETKIDQDRFLAGQLTLWDQRGSQVIRGNTLAIPIEDSLLYLQPIYLQADTAAYPELRLVVAMHGDNMSYGETFDEAMEGLVEGGRPSRLHPAGPSTSIPAESARRARDAFDAYLSHQAAREFQSAGRDLEDLSTALDELVGGGEGNAEPSATP
jgi:uncharacterized membrane protein (UPF0182 family)